MAALSDTPTPTILAMSETGGVSVKIEQGVLHDGNDDNDVSGYSVESRGTNPTTQYESNHHPQAASTENGLNGNAEDNYSKYTTSNRILHTDIEIKHEPPVNIDDTHPEVEESEENTSFRLKSPISNLGNTTPKIRLTPTSKLIATPNGSGDKKRRYVCPYENCTKSYGKSSHLRSHLTWHTGIKAFVCKEPGCGKGFTRSDELNRHIRTHTGEKPFECVKCAKKFSRSDHLNKHLVTHAKQIASEGALGKKIKIDWSFFQGTSINVGTKVPPLSAAIEPNTQFTLADQVSGRSITASKQIQNSPEQITNEVETARVDSFKIKLEKPENSDEYKTAIAPQEANLNASPELTRMPQLESNIKSEPELNIKPEPLDETHASELTNMSYENEPDDDAIMPEANLSSLPQSLDITTTTTMPQIMTTIHVRPATLKRLPPLPQSLDITTTTTMPQIMTTIHVRPPTLKCLPPLPQSLDITTTTTMPQIMTPIQVRPPTLKRMPYSVYDPTRPYRCSLCTKNFKRQDDVNRHMRTHTGEKPFACNECDKCFMRSDHLKKHMNTHIRIR